MLLPYKILIEFTMTVMGPPTLLFLFSFVALRLQEPDMQRDFKIPGGTAFAIFCIIPPVITTCTQLYFSYEGAGEGSTLELDGVNVPKPSLLSVVVVVGMGCIGESQSFYWTAMTRLLSQMRPCGPFIRSLTCVCMNCQCVSAAHVIGVLFLGFDQETHDRNERLLAESDPRVARKSSDALN